MLVHDREAAAGIRGVSAELQGTFRHAHGRTVLADAYFRSPLKIAKTFRPADRRDGLAVTVMDASPGFMDRDEYALDWDVGEDCSVGVTTQSFAKIHPCPHGAARQHTRIRVAKGAALTYAPQPSIPYTGSRFHGLTEVSLAEGSSFLYMDVLCPGRTHRGELFRYALYDNELRITVGGRPAAFNRLRIEPELHAMTMPGVWESFTHLGTLYGFGPFVRADTVERLRAAAGDRLQSGVSLAASYGLVANVLGFSAWEVQEALAALGREFARAGGDMFVWP